MALNCDFSKLDSMRQKMETKICFEEKAESCCKSDSSAEAIPILDTYVPAAEDRYYNTNTISAYTESGLSLDKEIEELEDGVEVLKHNFEESLYVGEDPQKLLIDKKTKLPVAVYIPEEFPKSLQKKNGRYRKLHLTDCYSLKKMRDEGRFDRYTKSLGKGDLFKVKTLDGNESYEELTICRYCIRQLNPDNYCHKTKSEKEEFLRNFSIGDFLRKVNI